MAALSDHLSMHALLLAGADDAWTDFFNTHSSRVWNYAARLIGADQNAVQDVVQEVFSAAVTSIDRYQPDQGTIIRWLLGITHRKAAMYWRKQGRNILTEGMKNDVAAVASEFMPDLVVVNGECRYAVRAVLATLPDDMALLLVGRYLDGRSSCELGEELGITEQAVRSRLVRARDRFRDAFTATYSEFID